MLRVLGCVTEQHDLRLVVLAGIVCFFACFAAIGLMMRARDALRLRPYWLIGAGIVSGAGIWSTHFVAMLAFQGHFPIGYEFVGTLLSIIIAVAVSGLGFALAVRLTNGLWGGAVVGIAIALMHYTGMSALHMPARISWAPDFVVASVLLGVAGSMAAMHLAMQAQTWRGQLSAATVLTLAICALHFTAMAAVTLVPTYTTSDAGAVFAPASLAVAVAAITLLIVGIGFAGAVVDHHLERRAVKEAERLRKYVAELEATKQELEQTSANLTTALSAADAGNRAKSEFLAAMSHELRTPLNAIIGFSEVIGGETFGPLGHTRYAEYIADIHKSGKHLLSLINDVLDLSRLGEGQLVLDEADFDLCRMCADAISMVGAQAKDMNVRLVNRTADQTLTIRGDQRRLLQVLLNLLSNAIKFTPEGGGATLDTAVTADSLRISVADTGIGMHPNEIQMALEPFGQVDSSLARKYEGAGLGLPLAKQLVDLHGGTLSIASVPGKGSTVTIQLSLSRVVDRRQAA